MADVLNIPKKKPQFEAVSFVQDMTQHQLKVLVKRMWLNIQELATNLDESRPDIAMNLDNLLDGVKINPKTFRERKQYFKLDNAIVEYDANKNEINVLDNNGNIVVGGSIGVDLKTLQKTLNQQLKDNKK